MSNGENRLYTRLEADLVQTVVGNRELSGAALSHTADYAMYGIELLNEHLEAVDPVFRDLADQQAHLLQALRSKISRGRPASEIVLQRILSPIVDATNLTLEMRRQIVTTLHRYNRYYDKQLKGWPRNRMTNELALVDGINTLIGSIRGYLNINNLTTSLAPYQGNPVNPERLIADADIASRNLPNVDILTVEDQITEILTELARYHATSQIIARQRVTQELGHLDPPSDNSEGEARRSLIEIWSALAELYVRLANYHGPQLHQLLQEANLEDYLIRLEQVLTNYEITAHMTAQQQATREMIEAEIGRTQEGIDNRGELERILQCN